MRRPDVELRLVNWARWTWRKVGRGEGYSQRNTIARWGEGTSTWREARIPIIDEDAAVTDEAVRALELRLQDTVRAMYLEEITYREASARLGCASSTVHARVGEAHEAIHRWLAQRAAARRGGRALPGLGEGGFPH